MITKEDIDRINLLYKKSKGDGLTGDEISEQKALRQKYINHIKAQVKLQLGAVKPEPSEDLKDKKES